MNVLEDKQYKSYNYISRYSSFPFYYNKKDKKYIYGITNQLSKDNEIALHKVVDYDTLDSLSLHYYGRPDYYWVIADYNNIKDPYINLKDKYTSIMIPSLGSIQYED